MPLTYLDSSALVKLYVEETGSTFVAHLSQTERITVSELSVAEVASSLARRVREDTLSPERSETLFRLFLTDTQNFITVSVGIAVIRRAADLLMVLPAPHRLRSLDALHIASAESSFDRARLQGIATGSFVTADLALAEAAKWAGLSVLNPLDYP